MFGLFLTYLLELETSIIQFTKAKVSFQNGQQEARSRNPNCACKLTKPLHENWSDTFNFM